MIIIHPKLDNGLVGLFFLGEKENLGRHQRTPAGDPGTLGRWDAGFSISDSANFDEDILAFCIVLLLGSYVCTCEIYSSTQAKEGCHLLHSLSHPQLHQDTAHPEYRQQECGSYS